MTEPELRNLLNDAWGIHDPWPPQLEVDADTYGHVCAVIFTKLQVRYTESRNYIKLSIGPNKGIMYKNIELILNNNIKDIQVKSPQRQTSGIADKSQPEEF